MKTLLEQFDLGQRGKGAVDFYSIESASKKVAKHIHNHNLILYSGADVLAAALSGKAGWFVNTMYLEYQNLASPSDPTVIPTFSRGPNSGSAYYNTLGASPNSDFLRVSLLTNPLITSTNPSIYDGNQVAFFALSEGSVGFFGKVFGPSVNSAVVGAALVCAPDPTDQATDVVFARTYTNIDKILAQAGFQIGVNWITQLT